MAAAVFVPLGGGTLGERVMAQSSDAELSWEEAVAAGHPAVADFRNTNDLPVCAPVEDWKPALQKGDDPPNDAGVCFAPPDDLGLVFVDQEYDCARFPPDFDAIRYVSRDGCVHE